MKEFVVKMRYIYIWQSSYIGMEMGRSNNSINMRLILSQFILFKKDPIPTFKCRNPYSVIYHNGLLYIVYTHKLWRPVYILTGFSRNNLIEKKNTFNVQKWGSCISNWWNYFFNSRHHNLFNILKPSLFETTLCNKYKGERW